MFLVVIIARRKAFENVIQGIYKAIEIGLNPVKLNVVLIQGVNDDQIDKFIEMTRDLPIEVRFIELMPIGEFAGKNRDKTIYNEDVLKDRPWLEKHETKERLGPAEYYSVKGYIGKVGFISPMGHGFCSSCNRLRLMSDGKLRMCLGDNVEFDIFEYLNQPDEVLETKILEFIDQKPKGNKFNEKFISRTMDGIGG